eukprot:TRINITY_DN1474_c0_g5_i1.p1 TRINITY_DN1474_c0_g5~~TRINITY_DN1474_c0_g5_i1.p1  ORF type:complete len:633 (+),score=82.74 TRINITY_DN1474_c0_g5_i1:275-2173(+)
MDERMELERLIDERQANTKDYPFPEYRKCRDIFFLILFILFCGGMGLIAYFAILNGNPYMLIYGVDDQGNICGIDNIKNGRIVTNNSRDLTDYKYLYYIFYGPPYANDTKVCVQSCPTENHLDADGSNSSDIVCPMGVDPIPANMYPNGLCYGSYASVPILNRCGPSIIVNETEEIYVKIISFINTSLFTSKISDVFRDAIVHWYYILAGTGVAFVMGIVWIFLMSYLTGLIVWLSLFFVVSSLGALSYLLIKQSMLVAQQVEKIPFELQLLTDQQNIEVLKVIGYASATVCVLLLLVILFMSTRISIAIGIIKETSRAITDMLSILLFPIFPLVLIVILAAYWVIVGAFLVTSTDVNYDITGNFEGYKVNIKLRYLELYHLFGGLWILNFILGIAQATIAGAIGSWYWVHDKRDAPTLPVLDSLSRTMRYHLGSIAFGSFLIALIGWFRIVIWLVKHGMQNVKKIEQESKLVKALCCWLNCCLVCFQKLIKFIDRIGYVMVSIFGYSFCNGVREGMSLVSSNPLRVAAVNCVGGFVIFIGKLWISVSASIATFVYLTHFTDMTYYILPVIIVGVLSYAISCGFMEIYHMGMETILLCFCHDCAVNSGSRSKRYYMSEGLRNVIESGHGCCC